MLVIAPGAQAQERVVATVEETFGCLNPAAYAEATEKAGAAVIQSVAGCYDIPLGIMVVVIDANVIVGGKSFTAAEVRILRGELRDRILYVAPSAVGY